MFTVCALKNKSLEGLCIWPISIRRCEQSILFYVETLAGNTVV